uniref:Uncharacterized protein n=1 Tax=Panagrolaimus sp. PS1159 TaxID=55785 RepID=A0AC35GAA5_9BILA
MTIACQPNLPKAESTFNTQLKVTEKFLSLLKQNPDGFIPGESFHVSSIPGLSLQPLFAVKPQPGEGQKFVVGLRINKNSVAKTTTFPFEMNYSVNFKSGNFSQRYSTTSVPVNPDSENVETFDALVMKVFNFTDVFDQKKNFINNGEIDVTVVGSIRI